MSNNLDPLSNPLNIQTINEIDSLDLPIMKKHHVRILAHCLHILKIINADDSSELCDKKTLREWKIRIDESLFLGGMDKTSFLKDFGADIFFDDQIENCKSACLEVPTGQVINFNSRI